MSKDDFNDTLTVSAAEQRIEWKIPNFLSLPHKKDEFHESTPFQFLDESWQLMIFPRAETEEFGSRYITLYLHKFRSDNKARGIQYRTGIKKSDGSEYRTYSGEAKFEDYESESEDDESDTESYNSDSEDGVSESEDDESESEDDESESEDDESSRSVTELEKRSVLCKKSTELLPKGVLTVFCILRTNKSGNKEVNTQPRITADFRGLSVDFKDLFLSEKGSDVTLKVQNREFKAHKAILRARSSVFDSMFTHNMIENNSGIVTISDCLPEAFQDLLLYMYSGNVEKLSTNNIFGLYQAADKYHVMKLKEDCVQYMMDSLSVETFCDVLALALRHDEWSLTEKAKMFFSDNERSIIGTSEWLFFLKDHPLEANKLHIMSLNKRLLCTKVMELRTLISKIPNGGIQGL